MLQYWGLMVYSDINLPWEFSLCICSYLAFLKIIHTYSYSYLQCLCMKIQTSAECIFNPLLYVPKMIVLVFIYNCYFITYTCMLYTRWQMCHCYNSSFSQNVCICACTYSCKLVSHIQCMYTYKMLSESVQIEYQWITARCYWYYYAVLQWQSCHVALPYQKEISPVNCRSVILQWVSSPVKQRKNAQLGFYSIPLLATVSVCLMIEQN